MSDVHCTPTSPFIGHRNIKCMASRRIWLYEKTSKCCKPLANVNKLRSYIVELQVCSTSAKNFKFDRDHRNKKQGNRSPTLKGILVDI